MILALWRLAQLPDSAQTSLVWCRHIVGQCLLSREPNIIILNESLLVLLPLFFSSSIPFSWGWKTQYPFPEAYSHIQPHCFYDTTKKALDYYWNLLLNVKHRLMFLHFLFADEQWGREVAWLCTKAAANSLFRLFNMGNMLQNHLVIWCTTIDSIQTRYIFWDEYDRRLCKCNVSTGRPSERRELVAWWRKIKLLQMYNTVQYHIYPTVRGCS